MSTQNPPSAHSPATAITKTATAENPTPKTTPATGPTLQKVNATIKAAKKKKKKAAGSLAYEPVTDAEVETLLACSATRGQGKKALAAFRESRSSDDLFATQPYVDHKDPSYVRLTRYLTFFSGRESKTSTSGRKTSGWPITREKFLLWAARDPFRASDSITLYLQTIEAARAATHHLLAPLFPELSNQSLLLDPLVQVAVTYFEPSLPAQPSPAGQSSKPAAKKRAGTGANATNLGSQRGTGANTTNLGSQRSSSTIKQHSWVTMAQGPSASACSLPPKPIFLAAKPSQQTAPMTYNPSAFERPALSQIVSPGNLPWRRDLQKKFVYTLESSGAEAILSNGHQLPFAPQLPNPEEKEDSGVLANPRKSARSLSESSDDIPLTLLPAPLSYRKKIKTSHCDLPISPPAVDLTLEPDELVEDVPAPPIYDQILVFTETRVPAVRQQFLEALRRDHRNNLSTEDVLEGLKAEINSLTGPKGESRSMGSEEDLTACLKTYLDYWASEGIAGFPMGALKVCVWLDSIEPTVTAQETRDISRSFDGLCRNIAAAFPEDQPAKMFAYPCPILDAPLWRSFLDFYQWPADILPSNFNPVPTASRDPSCSTVENSPSSHPQSPPFFHTCLDTSISLKNCLPDAHTGLHFDPKHMKTGLFPREQLAEGREVEYTPGNYRQFCYTRDWIGSVEHRKGIQNLHRFLRLLA
ncbi:hypothetical protein PtB15_18B310 [Puccinia triticina]|nr:hypothetical protein PtB15_18B310 [Puccinia triticina]